MAAIGRPPDPLPSSIGGIPVSHLEFPFKSYAATLTFAPPKAASVATVAPPRAATSTSVPPQTAPPAAVPSIGLHKGLPLIEFEDNLLQDLSAPFGWSLIGKFTQGFNRSNPELGRPSAEKIHKHLLSLDFRGSFTVGLMDNRHVWIHFSVEDDYLRLYSRPIWYIAVMISEVHSGRDLVKGSRGSLRDDVCPDKICFNNDDCSPCLCESFGLPLTDMGSCYILMKKSD